MKKILKTIYHDSTENYVSNPFPKKGEKIDIKIRVVKNDKIENIFLRYKDLGVEKIEKMKFSYSKNNLDYYVATAQCNEDVLSYQFYITTKNKIYYYTQYKISNHYVDESKNFKILVDYNAPKWMNKTVFYQIMTDRFYNSKPEITVKENSYKYRGTNPINMKWEEIPYEYSTAKCMDFYGGDLYGIIEKLDYLQDLGVNAIYLNPIFTSPTMHKYDALTYFEIDPYLGGNEALEKLSNEIHKRGMKLILDISINHTSSSSKCFNKDGEFYDKSIGAYNNPNSKEREYYFIDEDGNYDTWAGVETMPSLNYTSKPLRDIIYKNEDSALKKWMNPPYNIDGWRFDVADVMARSKKVNVYYELWEDINKELKSTKDEFLILAEEWSDTSEMYNGYRWDSTMNYFASSRPIREFAGEGDLFNNRNEFLKNIKYDINAKQLKNRILSFYDKNPTQIQYQMFNLINSHDVTRLHNNPNIDFEVYKGGVITLFGLPGAVNIYYGDEKYLDGRITSVEGARYPMDWNEKIPAHKEEIFNLYKNLSNLKTKNKALQTGGFKILYAKGNIFSFARFTENEAYIFVWNKEEKESNFSIRKEIFGFDKFEILIGDAKIENKKNKFKITTKNKKSILIKLWN